MSDIEKDKQIEETEMEIAKISFSFTFTRDEAEAYIKKPKGQIARKMRKYMCSIFEAAAKKMLKTKPEENVTNCELDIE